MLVCREGNMRHISEVISDKINEIDAAIQRGDHVTGIPSGYKGLDRILLGFQPGDLIVISARPSMGKTSFALNLALNAAVAKPPHTVLYCSLEMNEMLVATRILCISESIDSGRIRSHFLSKDDFDQIRKAQKSSKQIPLYIEDSPRLTVRDLRAEAWRMKATDGLDMVIIDYLHLMDCAACSRDHWARDDENLRQMKILAEDLNVPLIVLTQLSRGPENRPVGDKRPYLSDLRERCSADQHADVVIFLYRAEYYEKAQTKPEDQGVMEVIIAKNRGGPTGVVRLLFIPDTMRVENLNHIP